MTVRGWSSMARVTFVWSPADNPVSLCIVLLIWMTCAPLPLGQAEVRQGFSLTVNTTGTRTLLPSAALCLGDKANAVHALSGL